MNFSYREWVRETKNTLLPQFSDGFAGKDGKYRIAITYPIIIKNVTLDQKLCRISWSSNTDN